MNKRYHIYIFLLLLMFLFITGCKKQVVKEDVKVIINYETQDTLLNDDYVTKEFIYKKGDLINLDDFNCVEDIKFSTVKLELEENSDNNYIFSGSKYEYLVENFIVDGNAIDKNYKVNSDIKVSVKYIEYSESTTINFNNLCLDDKGYNSLYNQLKNILDDDSSSGDLVFNDYIIPNNLVFDGITIQKPNQKEQKVENINIYNDKNSVVKYNFYTDIDKLNGLVSSLDDIYTFDDIDVLKEIVHLSGMIRGTDYSKVDILKLNNLNSEYQKLCTAENIYDRINKLPEIDNFTYKDRNLIDDIKDDYNNLDEYYQNLISNYNLIEQYDNRIEEILLMYGELAHEFDSKILKLCYVPNLKDADEIKNIYNEYLKLDENIKSLSRLNKKLEKIYNELVSKENKPNQNLYYTDTTTYIFNSKDELFEAFYGDLYYFIIYQDESAFNGTGIKNVSSFLNYAHKLENVNSVGNICGKYLLHKDINGIIENQPDTVFVGYCYQNNLYEGLFEFFIRFFSYWRIDEGYASHNNYGADFFAEAWAPMVDISKFFNHTEETLPKYYHTERLLDCFNYISNVVYNENGTYRLRGYIYSNGSWVKDSEYNEIELAKTVQLYIYNLTTTKAVVNKTTVSYVSNMNKLVSKNIQNEYISNIETLYYYERLYGIN